MFDLKIDPKRPHHYLLSVGIHSMIGKNPGKMFLKHGPVHFTNEDVENLRSAAILSQDKLFKTSDRECLKNFECTEVAGSVRYMGLAANANMCSVHHFSSQYEISDEWFENLVDLANVSEHNKELLIKSRVRC